jgi:hypothetical protein
MTPTELGRLFQLKLKRNYAARVAALESIRLVSPGRAGSRWEARIGGKMRGRTERFASKDAATYAVNYHYNEQMMQFISDRGTRHA